MIAASALQLDTQLGTILFSMPAPARHSDIISALNGLKIDVHKCEQGFITSGGQFVDRVKAMRIAQMMGQVKEPKHRELFSEDLW